MIKHIIFDVDKTIYPASCGFGDEMDRRITEYTSRLLNKPMEEAQILRKKSIYTYGTTMRWLQVEHGMEDIEDFLDKIHPKDVENYMPHKREINNMFSSLPCPASVLSNGPMENVDRILNYYNIRDHFHFIADIRYNNFIGKPNLPAYNSILNEIQEKAENILFIDDVEQYLVPFHKMGGRVLLINESSKKTENGFDEIRNILELPEYLEKYGV